MIELLNPQKNWAKIRAGFKGGDWYKNPQGSGSFNFQAAPTMSPDANPVLQSAFGGKNFKQKLRSK